MIKYWIWFSRIEKISCINKYRLLTKYKNPFNIWNLKKADIKYESFLNDMEKEELVSAIYRENLDAYEKFMRNNNITLISLYDELYPEKLKSVYDKPIVLYAKGNLELLNVEAVAIIGARNCSMYGKKCAQQLAFDLAKNNKCVISGLARGIDKYAHIGALKAKGNTVAVIGNGIDYIYPSENESLAMEIIENNGLILSEYVMGTKPNRLNFPERNRIISALSDGIVVVEAKEKSGALITVEFGLEQGKEIYAVPGNIDSINSVGTNNLIKDGANIVTSYKDIITKI